MTAAATVAPHSPEAEVSVLGACLQDAEAALLRFRSVRAAGDQR